MPYDDDKAADRWYARYMELQRRTGRRDRDRAEEGDIERALRQVEERLRSMDVYVGRPKRGMSIAGKRALLDRQRSRLAAAERERERQRRLQRERLLREQSKALGATAAEIDAAFREFSKAVAVEGDESWKKGSGRGRRPAPAIAQVRTVAFRTTEWADAQYAGTDYGDYPAGWVKERKGLHVTDIDGSEVYVAVEAVQRHVAAGRVPGYAALTPDEAESLHAVLVEVEHYQRGLLRQALAESGHDPEDVLRLARADSAQKKYRARLGLPQHIYSVECCGEALGPIVREEAQA